MTILHKSIRIINRETNQVTPRDTPESFDTYISELINHIANNTSVREYITRSNSTETIGCILAILANHKNENFVYEKMDIMANRLLLKEFDAQGQVRSLNTNVQKGSLIQALLFNEDADSYEYLLAKVEHSEWVDDSDFAFKTGFSKDKKTMWKSCLFILPDITATEFHAKIYSDTKAQYWSNGFLELDEMNCDETNTERAFRAIEATLGRGFRDTVSPDHTIIRNGFISYLKNNEHIDYPTMVEAVLGNYQPVDDNISVDKVQDVKEKLLEQPEKRNFDRQFNSVNRIIDTRIRKVYPINDGIDLRVTKDINDLSSTILAVEEHGAKYIKIRTNNDDTYNLFNY